MKELLDPKYLEVAVPACVVVAIFVGTRVMFRSLKQLFRVDQADFSDLDEAWPEVPRCRLPRPRRVSTPPVFRRRPSLPSRGFFL